jgi:periplasmic protein TonB
MNEEELEKKNKRTALLYTTILQTVFFFSLFFIVAWRAPDPPLPEYGIELNFGLDDQGSGDIQPETPVGNRGQQAEEPEESKPKVQEETPKVEEKATKQIESKPVEEQSISKEEQVVSKAESPVVVKEKKKDEVKPVEKPAEKPEEKKVEPKVEKKPVEEKPKVDPEAVYKPKGGQPTSDNKTTDAKAGTPGNHGDDPGKTGDKGNPQGTLDAKALYGKPGGGAGGSSLEISGWDWDEIPNPNVPNNITGRIVFEIIVNSKGEVDHYTIVTNSLNPEATKACREAVEKLTFSKTGTNVPETSKGKITFVVRAK